MLSCDNTDVEDKFTVHFQPVPRITFESDVNPAPKPANVKLSLTFGNVNEVKDVQFCHEDAPNIVSDVKLAGNVNEVKDVQPYHDCVPDIVSDVKLAWNVNEVKDVHASHE